jgi:hypothetical protein
MKWVLRAIVALVLLVVLAWAVGSTRPVSHRARTQARLGHSPEEVWAIIADFERWPEWNGTVKLVERLPDRNGQTILNVVSDWGAAETTITNATAPRLLVTDMDAGDFRGRWIHELDPAPGGGTILTITEEGEVGSPLFRAMMIFHDNHETMLRYHEALALRLGETVSPARVPLPAAR